MTRRVGSSVWTSGLVGEICGPFDRRLAHPCWRAHFMMTDVVQHETTMKPLPLLRSLRVALIVLTGLAAGISWGALEQSPQTRQWLSDSAPPTPGGEMGP